MVNCVISMGVKILCKINFCEFQIHSGEFQIHSVNKIHTNK